MGGGGSPSGGIYRIEGRLGSLPTKGAKPNSRYDLYGNIGDKIQSRWYDSNGNAVKNRDYKHGGNWPFPHDHNWINGERGRDHLLPDYINYY